MEKPFVQRKIFPSEGSTRLRRNSPDTPIVIRQPLKGLKIITCSKPTNLNGCDVKPEAIFSHKDDFGLNVFRRGVSLTPVGIYPLQKFRQVAVGGIRTIGGGTSKEAIRKARRKLRRP